MRLFRILSFVMTAAVLASCTSGPYIADPPDESSPDITTSELAYHTKYLSSDAMEGRGTGTPTTKMAAKYIGFEFARYGLKPGGEQGYMQPFEVVTGVEVGPESSMSLFIGSAQVLGELRKDWVPFSFSAPGKAEGPVVFAGYGISAPNHGHDDYEGVDVKDKVVLVFTGHPEEDNPHSELGMVSTIRSKALFAREAGAKALMVVRPDEEELYEIKYDNSPSDAGIIAVNISQKTANSILGIMGSSVEAMANTLNSQAAMFQPATVPGVKADIYADVNLVRKITNNVIGIVEGTDPGAKDRYIVVGAHYDHLGWGQEGSLYMGEEPQIHNGADDNASGTAAMMELAQYFAAHPPRHSIMFQAYSGEEMGTLGSLYWVGNPTVPLDNVMAMLNMDMVGRLADSTRKLSAQGSGTSPFWKPTLEELNKKYGFNLSLIPDGRGASDQSSFYNKDIPVLFFFSGLHTQYHRPSDDFETLNIDGMMEITSFVRDVIKKTDDRREPLAFTKVKGDEARQMRSFSIYVGTIPDYGADVEGFKLSGVSPGGPAEKAGMKAGDIMVKFGETEVKNIYDYMNALSLHKPGEEIPVVINRDGELITLTVVPEKK